MPPEVAKRLLDALHALRQIREFTRGLDFMGFSGSRLVRSAVERQFEIVGEALGRAGESDPELEAALPDLPRIVGLRNRLIHGYDTVDDQIIWDIVATKVAPLSSKLEQVLRAAGYPIEQ